MPLLHDIVKKYTFRYDTKLRTLCAPLRDYLGIHTFVYYHIDDDGNLAALSNYPEWFDFYYTQEYYLTNPYLVHPSLVRSGFVLTTSTSDKWYQDEYSSSELKYQVRNPFLIVQRNASCCEGFLFSSKKASHNLHVYMELLRSLEKFGQYFKREAKPLIERMKQDRYSLAAIKGKQFFQHPSHLPLHAQNPSHDNFLKAISPLTRRERECLRLFRQGHSAQATAALLGIARRTVEWYFESIKAKLGCRSKWELLAFDI